MGNGKNLLLEMFSLPYLPVAIFSSQSVFLNPALGDWSDEASYTSLQRALQSIIHNDAQYFSWNYGYI